MPPIQFPSFSTAVAIWGCDHIYSKKGDNMIHMIHKSTGCADNLGFRRSAFSISKISMSAPRCPWRDRNQVRQFMFKFHEPFMESSWSKSPALSSYYHIVTLSYHHIIYYNVIVITILPVVPHKVVAEVSKQETYRRGWFLWIMDGRARPLMDPSINQSIYISIYLP